MIHVDSKSGIVELSGTTMELLNDFANIGRGLYTSMAEDIGTSAAKKTAV